MSIKNICTLLLSGLLPCFGCEQNSREDGVLLFDVDVSGAKTLNLEGKVDIENIIPLETSDASLFQNIDKLYIGSDQILVASLGMTQGVYVFDDNGKFIRRIGRRGRGPGEFLDISGVQFDREQQIVYIHDRERQTMMTFDLNGDLLAEKRNDIWIDSFCKTPAGYWAYVPNNTADEGPALLLLDDDFKSVKGEFFFQKAFFTTTFKPRFFENEAGEFYFSYPFDNVIYQLSGNEPRPCFRVDFGNNTLPYDRVRKMTDQADFDGLIENGRYVGDVGDLVFCGESLYFGFMEITTPGRIDTWRAIYNTTSGQGEVYDGSSVVFPMEPESAWPLKRLSLTTPLTAHEGLWVYQLQPFDMDEEDISLLRDKLSVDIREDSNPLLVFVRQEW
jgi:hypothetical protein